MDNQEIRPKQVVIYAGAFIAFLIGSGFATGQEIMQYFAAYGWMGIAGSVVVFIMFLYVAVSFITVGYENKFPKGSDIYDYYCGKYIGKFYDYFSVLFIYMSFMVMIGGAGATIHQQYGLPIAVGGIGVATLVGGTVLFGLNKILNIIGKIGPVICVMSILLGLSAIILNPSGLGKVNDILPNLNLMKASINWIYAALSYVGFCMLWLAAFMSQMGRTAKSRKEASLGAIIGAVGFFLALIIVALGLMANLEQVAGTLVPSLILAGNIHPYVAIVFSLTIAVGIYTASVPLLWTVASRIAVEKSKKYKILTVVLTFIGAFVGMKVPFDKLVNIVYVMSGYVGTFLLILMIIKSIRVKVVSSLLNK